MKRLKNLFVALALCAPLTAAAQDIEINAENFPDENFRSYLLQQSYGRDGILTGAEIKNITNISVYGRNISSLKGIEYFTTLTKLQCDNNQLMYLDVSGCKYLTLIWCYHNMIKDEAMDAFINSLPERKPEEGSSIYIYDDLSGEEGNVCTQTQVAAMEAKGWRVYYCIERKENGSTWRSYPGSGSKPSIAIDEENFPDANFRAYLMEHDYGADGVLTEAEIDGITFIDVSNESISSLKGIEHFTALRTLRCCKNQLTALDVSNNTALTNLVCSNNQLTALDVSNNTALTSLNCFRNQIKGESMDALISSLPETATGTLYVYYENASDEGNVITKSQVAAAKAKGWTSYYCDGSKWQVYEGIDDDAVGVTQPEIEAGHGAVEVYTLQGQKVNVPQKGGIYIVDGKKVVVK